MNFRNLLQVISKPLSVKPGVILLLSILFLTGLNGQQEQFSRAQQLALSGQHAEAEEVLRQLASDHPDDLPAALLRAHNLSWGGQRSLAIDAFNAILQRHPGQVDALTGLG